MWGMHSNIIMRQQLETSRTLLYSGTLCQMRTMCVIPGDWLKLACRICIVPPQKFLLWSVIIVFPNPSIRICSISLISCPIWDKLTPSLNNNNHRSEWVDKQVPGKLVARGKNINATRNASDYHRQTRSLNDTNTETWLLSSEFIQQQSTNWRYSEGVSGFVIHSATTQSTNYRGIIAWGGPLDLDTRSKAMLFSRSILGAGKVWFLSPIIPSISCTKNINIINSIV